MRAAVAVALGASCVLAVAPGQLAGRHGLLPLCGSRRRRGRQRLSLARLLRLLQHAILCRAAAVRAAATLAAPPLLAVCVTSAAAGRQQPVATTSRALLLLLVVHSAQLLLTDDGSRALPHGRVGLRV